MPYDQYIDKIGDLLQQQGFSLDEEQRAIIQHMWERWEKDRPVLLEYDDENKPHLIIVSEQYQEQHATGYSSSSSSWVTITNHPAKCMLVASQYTFNENRQIAYEQKDISFSSRENDIEQVRAQKPEKADTFIDFDETFGKNALQNNVGSLAMGISTYLHALTGYLCYGDILPLLAEYEENRLSSYTGTFMMYMGPEIVTCMRNTNLMNSKMAGWLNDPDHGTYRLQAANAYPVFTRFFAGYYTYPEQAYRQRTISDRFELQSDEVNALNGNLANIQKAIDEGMELGPVLQDRLLPFKVSSSTLKSLGRIEGYPRGLNFDSFLYSIRYLDYLNPNQHPRTEETLKAYVTCVARAEILAEAIGRPADKILQNIKGQWQEWLDATESDTATNDVKDWLEQVKQAVIMPLLWQKLMDEKQRRSQKWLSNFFARASGGTAQSIKSLKTSLSERAKKVTQHYLRNISEAEMIACSQKWHENTADYQIQLNALGIARFNELCNWLPLSDAVQAPNGVWLRPLTNKKELLTEGSVHKHCIGTSSSYYTQCLAGQDHIISLSRDAEGQQRISTAQLTEKRNLKGDVAKLSVRQHRGFQNREATAEEEQAIKWYTNELVNNPDMTPDWEAIDKARKVARSKKDGRDIVGQLGFDPEDDGCCQVAYDIIRPYLPKKLSKDGYDKAIEKTQKSLPSWNEKFSMS